MVGSEWTALTSDLVRALAWPVALAALVVVFRTQIAGAIGHVRHLGVGNVQIDLGTAVEEVDKRVTQAADAHYTGPGAKVAPPLPPPETAMGAVHDAWEDIQVRLHTLAAQHLVGGTDVASLADGLADRNVISSHLGTAIRELATVQLAAPDLDTTRARTLAQAARWIANILDAVPAPLDLVAESGDGQRPAHDPVARPAG
jgi:hypothetical protein